MRLARLQLVDEMFAHRRERQGIDIEVGNFRAQQGIVDAALPQLDSWAGPCASNHAFKPVIVRAELARRAGEENRPIWQVFLG